MASATPQDALSKALARVAELEAELQASERGAELARKELQHFVYAASHDLQEPLRAVTTYTQLLERQFAADPEAREFMAFITSGVERMNSLLYKLLAYSRVNLSPVLTSVNLNAAVQGAMFNLTKAIAESKAQIRFVNLPAIAAHDIQMGQLFEQILSNSILFRRGEPQISILAEEAELDGESVQLVKITDNGVGIEKQFLTQVLEPFKRLHGKEYPGNGLGLAICEKIMRAHNGKIWLESDGQTGTTVCLAFPF